MASVVVGTGAKAAGGAATRLVGKEAGSVAGKEAGTLAGKAVGKQAGQQAGKQAGKTAGKQAGQDGGKMSQGAFGKKLGMLVGPKGGSQDKSGGSSLGKGKNALVKGLFKKQFGGKEKEAGIMAGAGGAVMMLAKFGKPLANGVQAAGVFAKDVVTGTGIKDAALDAKMELKGTRTPHTKALIADGKASMVRAAQMAPGSMTPGMYQQMAAAGNTQMAGALGYSPAAMASGQAAMGPNGVPGLPTPAGVMPGMELSGEATSKKSSAATKVLGVAGIGALGVGALSLMKGDSPLKSLEDLKAKTGTGPDKVVGPAAKTPGKPGSDVPTAARGALPPAAKQAAAAMAGVGTSVGGFKGAFEKVQSAGDTAYDMVSPTKTVTSLAQTADNVGALADTPTGKAFAGIPGLGAPLAAAKVTKPLSHAVSNNAKKFESAEKAIFNPVRGIPQLKEAFDDTPEVGG